MNLDIRLKNGEYVDDYIREQKRKGITEMYWSEEEWKLLNQFMDEIGGFTPLFSTKEGGKFYGVRHYLQKD